MFSELPCILCFLGYDAIANSAEEVKNPQRNMPIGIIGSLIIATVLYMIVTLS